MPHRCLFVPPHILANIARAHARESLEPSSAQRSATISDRFRRARRNFAPDGTVLTAALAEPKAVPEGLNVPQPGTAGRLVYDDLNQSNFDVKFVRGEGDPAVSGESANHAYDCLGLVRQFYSEKLGRNSIDNAGLNIVANVNFGVGFDNAFFDGIRMVFGNGDNTIFKDLTGDLDVPGHELTHGVTQYTAGLNYTADQTGALNESFSDIMGSAIDAWANQRDADSHNWLIGEDIMADDLYGEALRNMAEPGTAYDNPMMGRDPQPRDMSGYHEPPTAGSISSARKSGWTPARSSCTRRCRISGRPRCSATRQRWPPPRPASCPRTSRYHRSPPRSSGRWLVSRASGNPKLQAACGPVRPPTRRDRMFAVVPPRWER